MSECSWATKRTTRKERREALEKYNLGSEMYKCIRHFIPQLIPLLKGAVTDPRNQSYIKYDLYLILFVRIISAALNFSSMRNMSSELIEWPKVEDYTGAQVYNEKQIIKLLEGTKGDPMELMIIIKIYYGLRRSELLGLKWSAIDFEQMTITIKHTVTRVMTEINRKDYTKTKASFRTLPITDEIAEQLLAVRNHQEELRQLQPNDYKDEGYIFTRLDGTLIAIDYPTRHFKTLAKRIGLPVIRFHDLRHSAGTYLMYLGFSTKEIQEWLGHSNINTTLKYLHFDMDGKRNMLDKINSRLKA